MRKRKIELVEAFLNADDLSQFSSIEIRKLRFFAYHYNRYERFCQYYNKDWQPSVVNLAILKKKLQVFSINIATQTKAVAILNYSQQIEDNLKNESKLRNDLLSFLGRSIDTFAGIEPAIDKEFCKYFINLQKSFIIFYNKKDGKINTSLLFREIAKEFKKTVKEAEEALSVYKETSVLLPNFKNIGSKIYGIKDGGVLVPVKEEELSLCWEVQRLCIKRFKCKTLEEKKKVVRDYLKK